MSWWRLGGMRSRASSFAHPDPLVSLPVPARRRLSRGNKVGRGNMKAGQGAWWPGALPSTCSMHAAVHGVC